jgi:hypothetical protein
MSGTAKAPRMTRRRMLAGSGAAVASPLVLAACGTTEEDDRSAENDPDLLNSVLAQQLAVLEALKASGGKASPLPDVVSDLTSLREDSVAQLESFVEEQDGTPIDQPAEAAKGESPADALVLQLEDSIEASLAAIGDVSSPAYRQAIHRSITEDAAALAAFRSATGEEIAPDSFVFGAPATGGAES